MGVLLNNIIGFSIFGLGVRLWQLGLVNRPLFKRNELWTHAAYMVAFGGVGYGVVHLENEVSRRLAEIRELRARAKSIREEKAEEMLEKHGLPKEREELAAVLRQRIADGLRERAELLEGSAKERVKETIEQVEH